MTRAEEDRKRLIAAIRDRCEVRALEDGYYYYWPAGYGCIPAHQLRWIADELDRMNEAWDKQIQEMEG